MLFLCVKKILKKPGNSTQFIMKRIQIIFLTALAAYFASCSKEDNTEHIISTMANKDSIMVDLFGEWSDNGKTFMDISPIPVQAELYDYAEVDTNFQMAIDAIEAFNDMIEHPGILLGSSQKSTLDKSWEFKGCEEYGTMSECTYIQDHGEYVFKCVTTTQSITQTVVNDIYIGGTCDGINYSSLNEDEYYLKTEWTITEGGKQITITTFFDPVNDDVAGEVAFFYQYIAGEGRTIYTPWGGTERVINSTINNLIYIWDPVHGCHPSISTTLQWDGNLLTTLTSIYCANHDELKLFYSSAYDFEKLEGSWCIYDCDEKPIDCGSN
jgi:hypothetical protein